MKCGGKFVKACETAWQLRATPGSRVSRQELSGRPHGSSRTTPLRLQLNPMIVDDIPTFWKVNHAGLSDHSLETPPAELSREVGPAHEARDEEAKSLISQKATSPANTDAREPVTRTESEGLGACTDWNRRSRFSTGQSTHSRSLTLDLSLRSRLAG